MGPYWISVWVVGWCGEGDAAELGEWFNKQTVVETEAAEVGRAWREILYVFMGRLR